MRFKSEWHQPQLFLMPVKCQHHRHFMRGAAGHVPRSVRHETRGCEEIQAWSLGKLRCWYLQPQSSTKVAEGASAPIRTQRFIMNRSTAKSALTPMLFIRCMGVCCTRLPPTYVCEAANLSGDQQRQGKGEAGVCITCSCVHYPRLMRERFYPIILGFAQAYLRAK
jgi:hypothetical protein